MLKRLPFLLLFLFFASPVLANTYNPATCSQANVQAAFTSAHNDNVSGSTINIPSGTCAWTTFVDSDTMPAGLDVSCNSTVITDNYTATPDTTHYLWQITVSSSDSLGNHTKIHGCTINGGSGNVDKIPILSVNGSSHYLHIYNFTINKQTYSGGGNGWLIRLIGDMWGVIDHTTLKQGQNDNGIGILGPNEGDVPWSEATPYGAINNLYVEDVTYYTQNNGTSVNGSGNDCSHGGRQVFRFNNLAGDANGNTSLQTHPTGGSGVRARGCRHSEIYGNSSAGSNSTPGFNDYFLSSGTIMLWGNTSPSGSEKFLTILSMRRYNSTYAEVVQPNGWGYCGPAYQTGTVNTVGTAVVGTGFSTGWYVPFVMTINGTDYIASTVNSSVSITLSSSAGTQTGATYVVGSYADQNSDVNIGSMCLDQPGNGVGDLLSGSRPNTVNHTNGDAVSTTSGFWPRQASEPVYEWMNTHACSGCFNVFFLLDYGSGALVDNSTYFKHAGTTDPATSQIQTSNTSPFNGHTATGGTGFGTLANRPAACDDNTGYFVTNAAAALGTTAWYGGADSNFTGSGTFQKCISGTWTNYYTPYTYPHPLVTADEGGACTPDHLTFTAQPSDALVSAVLGTVTVVVKDSGGVTCGSDTSTITIANKGGTCSGMTLGGTKSGSNSFTTTDLTEDVAGACTLHATDGSLTAADSSSFTISAPPSSFGGAARGRVRR